MRSLYRWFDNLPEPKRFMVFLFGLAIPFTLMVNLATFGPTVMYGYTRTTVITMFCLVGLMFSIGIALALSRILYLRNKKGTQ